MLDLSKGRLRLGSKIALLGYWCIVYVDGAVVEVLCRNVRGVVLVGTVLPASP